MSILICIPARLASSRLANKMLADINGKPLILRTFEAAKAANVGDVIVACDCEEIAAIIKSNGGVAIITPPELPSGTDRIYAAYRMLKDKNKYQYVVNLQGDLPLIDPIFIKETINLLKTDRYDITTIASPITDNSYIENHIVKPVIAFDEKKNFGNALYFSRSAIPFGGPYYYHIGIYGYKKESLEKFISLPQSQLEKAEKLEQLRALENGLSIGITVVNLAPPVSVDVESDLQKARLHSK